MGHLSDLLHAIGTMLDVSRLRENTRNNKRECRTCPIIPRRPNVSLMRLNDGSADGESNAHSLCLRGVERFEHVLFIFSCETGTRIPDAQPDLIGLIPLGFDQQFPGTTVVRVHYIRAVSYQVQDDLLKLDAIA